MQPQHGLQLVSCYTAQGMQGTRFAEASIFYLNVGLQTRGTHLKYTVMHANHSDNIFKIRVKLLCFRGAGVTNPADKCVSVEF